MHTTCNYEVHQKQKQQEDRIQELTVTCLKIAYEPYLAKKFYVADDTSGGEQNTKAQLAFCCGSPHQKPSWVTVTPRIKIISKFRCKNEAGS